MTELNFKVDEELCVGCGECVSDCPLLVLTMVDDLPRVAATRSQMCINCQHCLMVCPVGAISISGAAPADCLPLKGMLPEADKMETLIRGRRSIRRYEDENLDSALVRHLLEVAWQAPTGMNARQVLFTVVDDKTVMARLRAEVMARLAELVTAGRLPEGHSESFSGFVKQWQEKGIDIIFRGAPHLLITSAPTNCPCPEPDCLIALSYFELLAQSMGVGTVWDGMATRALNEFMPEFKEKLGIPADHRFGYAMAFGKPAVKYHRTGSLRTAAINRVDF
ncbi:MAG TPA: 4Fe-4S dicluster domain-containing protein [Desulfobacterales bacterium]|nr:4Fe-4S dicluster domain-containing protein [Desulfobacterales bacterium]